LIPASDGSDDFIGIGGPHEGLGVIVGFLQEAVDGGLEIDNRAEGAAFKAAFGQFGEEALDRIEPRGRGRGVMEDKAGVPVEPGADLGMLVRGVVVEDDMDDLAGGDVGFDRIEKANELAFVPMPSAVISTIRARYTCF